MMFFYSSFIKARPLGKSILCAWRLRTHTRNQLPKATIHQNLVYKYTEATSTRSCEPHARDPVGPPGLKNAKGILPGLSAPPSMLNSPCSSLDWTLDPLSGTP